MPSPARLVLLVGEGLLWLCGFVAWVALRVLTGALIELVGNPKAGRP